MAAIPGLFLKGAPDGLPMATSGFYCPIPADVSHNELVAAVASFRSLRLGGTAREDRLPRRACFTRLLIPGADSYARPAHSVRAIWVTRYKDMGQAHTVTATEQLPLPDWFDLRSARHASLWLRTLEEHDTIIRRLTDTHSDRVRVDQAISFGRSK